MQPDDIKAALDKKFGGGSDSLKGQLAAARNVKPATTLGEFFPANFEPTDEQVERAKQEVATHTPEKVDLDEPVNLAKASPEDITTLTGLKGRTASALSTAASAPVGAAESLLTSGIVGAPAKVAGQLGAGFVAQMAAAVPSQLSEAAGHYSAGDTALGDAALINGLVTAGMIVLPAAAARRKPTLDSIVGADNAQQMRNSVKGGENYAIQKQGAGTVGAHPVGDEGAGQGGGQGVGRGLEGQEAAGEGAAKTSAKVLLKQPFRLEHDEGTGKYTIENSSGGIVSQHDSFQEAKLAMDKLKVGAKASPATTISRDPTAHFDYTPEDLAAYKAMKDEQQRMANNGEIMVGEKPNQQFNPKWQELQQQFEKLRNKYNGNPPKQLLKPVVPALSPEDQAHLDAERGTVSHPVEVVHEADTGNPFAKRLKGRIATIDRVTGKILINAQEFSDFLKDVPKNLRGLATRSVLAQEQNHLATDPAAAKAYWNSLTKYQQRIFKRIYSGGEELPEMNDTMWGFEATSYAMNRLAKMTPHELLMYSGKEKWKLKSLFILETAINGIRKALGTKSSREGTAILDAIQKNINLGKTAAGRGEMPAALSKKAQELAMKQADDLDEHARMYVESGDAESGRELTDMANRLRQQYFDQSFQEPAARPKKRQESVFQERFILPGEETKKVAGETKAVGFEGEEPPAVPEVERKTAEAAGALPRLSGAQIGSKATEWIDKAVQGAGEAPVPKFKDFVEHMQGVDPSLKPGQLHEMWYQGIANRLASATGEELGNLVRKVWGKQVVEASATGGKKAFFRGIISGAQSVPDLPATGQFKLEHDVPGRTAAERYQDERKVAAIARGRDKVIGALFNKLAKTALPDIDFHAESTEPEDLRYGGGKAASSVQDFDHTSERNETMLGNALVDEARRSGDDPLTATKRLTAIMDRKTGTVDLVGTYRHPSSGVMLVDPNSPNRTHSPLDSILRRYRVIQSVLRDAPVQGFRQHFKSLEEYNDKFANEARDRYRAETSYDPDSVSEEQFMSETAGRINRGSGGSFMGPGKQAVETEGNAIEKSSRTPMTVPEAEAIIDHVLGEQGTMDSPDDVREAMMTLKEIPNRQAISGLAKLARGLQESHPDFSQDELLNLVARRIYENHTHASSLEDFAKRTMAESRPAPGEDAGPEEKQVKDTKRELTMPIDRRPPTDVRGAVPGNAPPMPEATTVVKPVAMMSPAEKAFVGREASRKARLRREGQDTPAAINRRKLQEGLADEKEKISGEVTLLKNRTMATFARRPTAAHLSATIDGADNLASAAALNTEQAIRLESTDRKNPQGKKEILSGANAYYATGAVKTRYQFSDEAMAEADRLMREDEEFKKDAEFANRKRDKGDPQLKLEGETANGLLHQKLQKRLLETGFLNHQDATYYHDDAAREKLDEFMARVKLGDDQANQLKARGGAWDRFRANRWLKNNKALMSELEFAKAHWDNEELRNTAMQVKKQLDRQFDLETANGYHLNYDDNYLPGRYDGELFSKNGVLFGGLRLLGRQFRSAKVFPTYYHAAEAGPYVAASRDAAAIVGSRARQGIRSLNRTLWWNLLKGLKDDTSGKMVASDGKEKNGRVNAPSPDYHEFKTPTGNKIYVLDGYEHLVHQLTDPSSLQHIPVTRVALETSQFLKHTVLMGDLFHLGRVGYYAASITGKNTRYRPGWAALNFREEDIPKAVAKGVVSARDAAWLTEKVAFTADGRPSMVSRMRLTKLFLQSGLNASQISDAIYKDLVRNVPGFGRYNKFLFDRFTPGLMMNSALREFDRLSKLEPGNDSRDILQRVSKDLNEYFGSIGRQGVFKSATMQDLMRLGFLAPQWLEGLVRKELSPIRAIGSPVRALTGHDTMLRGMARGLLSMIVLTQVINLINRRQPTWQNEKGHKWDAEVGDNVWLSPLAVFNELTADLIRLNSTKPKTWDAIQQIGENKLGFYGRAAMVLATGKGAGGQYKSTTAGVLGEAARQFVPSPISLGPLARAAGHALAPGLVSPNPPGKLTQSIYSSTGLKTHIGQDAEGQMRQSAARFNQAHGKTAPDIQYTDDPSYSQLRYLVKIGDRAGAAKMLKSLGKTPQQIMLAMREWARRPFTGSNRAERLWVAGMTDEERAAYTQAVNEKMQEFTNFENWYVGQMP